MLYEQLRYAEVIRKLYKLRHLLVHKAHPDIGSRVGYEKYSKQFYRITKKLVKEGILDKEGRFVENLLNLWLVELPLDADDNQVEVLGNRIPYTLFLSLCLDSPKKSGELTKELNLNRMSAYLAIEKLKKTKLIRSENSSIVAPEGGVHRWLLRYLDLCKTHADTTDDISPLFNTVPAYIGGKQAYYIANYEPGRPVGPSDMAIMTFKPFLNFWESVIKEISYFTDYPKEVEIILAKPKDRIVWIDKLPYKKTGRSRWEYSSP
jgi:predicted transcriptional regulator